MRWRSKKKKTAINKDIHAEGLCFVCKDGGVIRICDFRNCLKSYHHGCVGENVSFLKSQNKWNCAWHRCFRCRKPSYLYCYMCTNAVCLRCLPAADILRVKGAYGFCKPCLKLALLFEENREYDSNRVRVDFSDCNTFEGLFKEYYAVVKNKEGFESADLNAVKESVVRSLSEDSEEEQISEYDEFEDQKSKCRKTRKRPRGRKPTKKTPVRPCRSEEEQISEYDKFEDQKSEHGKTSKRPRGRPPTKKTPVRPDTKEFFRCSASRSFPSIVVENVKLVYLKRSVLNEMLKEPEVFEEKVTGCIVRVKSDPYESRKSHQLVQVQGAKTVSTDENTTETVLLLSIMPPTEIRISLITDEDFSEEEFNEFREKVEAGEIERPTVEVLQQKAISIHKYMTNARIRTELDLLENEWRRDRSEYLEKRKKLQSPKERARLLENVPTVIPESTSLSEPVQRDEPQAEKESDEITEHGIGDASHMGERVPVSEMSTSVEPQQERRPDPEAKRLEANEPAADSNPESTSLFQPVQRDEPQAEKESNENTENGVGDASHMGERVPVSEMSTSVEPQQGSKPDPEAKRLEVNEPAADSNPDESTSLFQPMQRDEPQAEKESDENTEHGVGNASHVGERVPVSEMSTSVEPQQGSKPDPEAKRLEANEPAAYSNPAESTSLFQPVPRDEPQGEKESEENTEKHGVDASDYDKGERPVLTSETSEVKRPIEVIEITSDDDEEDEVWCMNTPDGKQNKLKLRVLRSWCKRTPYMPSFMVWKEKGREEDAIPFSEAVSDRSART